MQFNLNERIVKNPNGDVIALGLREKKLYGFFFIEVHEAYATNYIYIIIEERWCTSILALLA